MRRFAAVLGAALLILAVAGPVTASSSDQHAVHYYLSLGDSLAAGYQPTGDPNDMYRTSDGYADQLYAIARTEIPKLRHVKLGCPGETTVTMIEGGICPYEEGSQLAEAVEFLHAHAKFVSFVTIDIGWNDVGSATACILAGGNPTGCVQPGIESIQEHLPVILAALHDAAPNVPIVGMNLYDPFLGYWFQGQQGQAFAMLSVDLIAGTESAPGINDLVAGIFDGFGMDVADVETAFQTTSWTPPVEFPPGSGNYVPLNVATVCALTWMCTPYFDVHPNTAGYGVMAQAFAEVLGL